jgi:hypothetical protein
MYDPFERARVQTYQALSPQMQGTYARTAWGQPQGANPFRVQQANSMQTGTPEGGGVYMSNAVDRENVQASQGAGASAGADWTARLGQQVGQDMGQMQRQQDLGQAAMMRNTNTPGGMQAWTSNGPDSARWGQMMQGLQGMRQGMQRRGNRF